MEPEFRQPSPSPGPSRAYGKLLVEGLRKQRGAHPYIDAAAGMVPGVGAAQSAMDVTDSNASTMDKVMSAASFIPGGKLMRILATQKKKAKLLRKTLDSDIPLSPEEIFQKPDVIMTPEQREAARKAANQAYIEQLLREGEE